MDFRKLIFFISSLFIISCASSDTTETDITTNKPTIDLSGYDTTYAFKVETLIDIWALRNPNSYYYSFKGGKTGGERFKPDTLENGVLNLGFLSFKRDEKINLYMYPSDSAYSFSVIELQPSTKNEADEESKYFGIYKDPIYTGNKIRLGSKKADVLQNTGEPMNVDTNGTVEILKYWIEGNHLWLYGHHTDRYFLTYHLKNGKVNKIRFGFEPLETE